MATTLIGLLPGSGAGEATPDSGRVTLKYLVKSDTINDNAPEVAATSGLPTGFSTYSETYPQLRVKKIAPERMGNSLYWQVTVEYSTPDKNTTDSEQDDPIDVRPEISIDYETMEVPIWGVYGNERIPTTAVKNSAGWVFNPPFMKQLEIPIYTFKVNRAANTFGLSTLHQSYVGCINSESYLGYAARTLKLVNVKPVTQKQNELEYLQTSYVIKFNPYTWDLIPLDYGPYYIESGKKLEFKSDDGHPEGNGLLDGSGAKTTTPTYLPARQTYTSIAFSGLSIPSDLSVYKYV